MSTKSGVPRVVQFIPGFLSGGIESFIMTIYRNIDRSQLQFDFVVDTLQELHEFEEIRALGGRVFQLGRYLSRPMRYQYDIDAIFKKYGQEYVALHCHSVLRALPILISGIHHGIEKRILHSHTDSFAGSRQALIASAIASVTNQFATEYWACSEAAGRFLFKRRSFKIVKNTIDTNRFIYSAASRMHIRQIYGISDDALVVGHTGRFTYQKNHAFIVDCFAKLLMVRPGAKLMLVGDGPLTTEIESRVVSLGLQGAVIFCGYQAEVAPFLSAMDVFLLPSHFEGFCISLLEAQANGLRCLASSIIQPEVQVSPLIVTRELTKTPSAWALDLLALASLGRAESLSAQASVVAAGFDIKQQSYDMTSWYKDT